MSLNLCGMSFAKVQRLENLLRNNNYQISQSNGQRIYSPTESSGIRPPPKGSEVFVGNLPPDVYEDELIPLFSTKGAIYNIRLMIDFFGRNRGYAFISYFRPEDAHAAVLSFNNYRLRNKTKLAVSMSVDNRRLFIGNIPKHLTRNEIRCVLCKYVDGIVNVILYQEPYNEGINRGFTFVEFETHRLAAIARRQLSPGNLVIWGQSIFVDWAEPLPLVSPHVMKNVTKIYLSNIPTYLSSDELKTIVLRFVDASYLIKVHKINNYAFAHFTLRKYAEEAFKNLTGIMIDNNHIGVEWARPIEYSKTYRAGRTPETYCKSVPPTMRKLVQESIDRRNSTKNSRRGSTSPDYFNGRFEVWSEQSSRIDTFRQV